MLPSARSFAAAAVAAAETGIVVPPRLLGLGLVGNRPWEFAAAVGSYPYSHIADA